MLHAVALPTWCSYAFCGLLFGSHIRGECAWVVASVISLSGMPPIAQSDIHTCCNGGGEAGRWSLGALLTARVDSVAAAARGRRVRKALMAGLAIRGVLGPQKSWRCVPSIAGGKTVWALSVPIEAGSGSLHRAQIYH